MNQSDKWLIAILFIAAIMIIVHIINYFIFMNTLQEEYDKFGIEGLCDRTNHTMVDGYCLIGEFGNYTKKFHCSWGKFVIMSSYNNKYIMDSITAGLLQCKYVKS